MASFRPIIGVTGPDHGGGAAYAFTRFAVYQAGGHAVPIRPRRPRSIDHLDGLIVGGGADVSPELYGQASDDEPILPDPKPPGAPTGRHLVGYALYPLTWLARRAAGVARSFTPDWRSAGDPRRDALEMRLIDQAIRRGLPVLGICRGEQLLNVYFGGTLHRELTGLYVEDPEVKTILPRKRIQTAESTRLRKLLGPDRRVNALHRQGVDRLGQGLLIAARDRNGIIQAIEHQSHPFVLGVQWHPEYLPQLPEQRALFEALVKEAKRCVARTPGQPCVSSLATPLTAIPAT